MHPQPAAVLLCAAIALQAPASNPQNESTHTRELLSNRRVTVNLVDLGPGDATPMHEHARDMIAVFVTGGRTEATPNGQKSSVDRTKPGEVFLRTGGFSHSVKNIGPAPFRVVTVDFADPQGKRERARNNEHYCNPGSRSVCVDERNLFCTARICVEDVTIAAGAITTRHSHSTDHMLVAISDYELTDQIEGRGTVVRTRKSGEVEYLAAGINHQLTNTGKAPARFIVIVWK